MKRIVTYEIENCNSDCPFCFHNYEDYENLWCSKLNKKVYDEPRDIFLIWNDNTQREIPEDCPLEKST